MFKDKFPQNLYHSYIIEGDPEIVSEELLSFLDENNFISKKLDEIFLKNYQNFSIADSSVIREWNSIKGEENKKRICILGTNFINREAEHSLLKTLEEPSKSTHFFIIIPNINVLQPTILSRSHLIKLNKSESSEEEKKFIKMSSKERIDFIYDLLKKHEKDETSGPLRSEAINFLDKLEFILYQNFKKDPQNSNFKNSLNEIINCKEYLNFPSSSVKIILEYIALVL